MRDFLNVFAQALTRRGGVVLATMVLAMLQATMPSVVQQLRSGSFVPDVAIEFFTNMGRTLIEAWPVESNVRAQVALAWDDLLEELRRQAQFQQQLATAQAQPAQSGAEPAAGTVVPAQPTAAPVSALFGGDITKLAGDLGREVLGTREQRELMALRLHIATMRDRQASREWDVLIQGDRPGDTPTPQWWFIGYMALLMIFLMSIACLSIGFAMSNHVR